MFYIKRIGFNFIHSNGFSVNRPNGSGNYLLLFFKSPVEITIDKKSVLLEPQTCILFNKKSPQQYGNKELFKNDWMHFDGTDIDSFINELDIPFDMPINLKNSKIISESIRDLADEFHQSGKCHEKIIDAKLKTLFYKFSDIYHQENKSSDQLNRYRSDFNNIRNSLYNFNNNQKSVPELASELNISTSYFQHLYKQLFGVPVMKDIIRGRIEYACYLLNTNHDSISNIAIQCGYENKEHFTRQFKEITGYTPKQYRQR